MRVTVGPSRIQSCLLSRVAHGHPCMNVSTSCLYRSNTNSVLTAISSRSITANDELCRKKCSRHVPARNEICAANDSLGLFLHTMNYVLETIFWVFTANDELCAGNDFLGLSMNSVLETIFWVFTANNEPCTGNDSLDLLLQTMETLYWKRFSRSDTLDDELRRKRFSRSVLLQKMNEPSASLGLLPQTVTSPATFPNISRSYCQHAI